MKKMMKNIILQLQNDKCPEAVEGIMALVYAIILGLVGAWMLAYDCVIIITTNFEVGMIMLIIAFAIIIAGASFCWIAGKKLKL